MPCIWFFNLPPTAPMRGGTLMFEGGTFDAKQAYIAISNCVFGVKYSIVKMGT